MPIVNPSGSPIVPATLAMVTVSLYSDVRALIAGQASMVHVLGGSAVGDGQDGIFYWNSTSTAADDGFATLAPNLGGTGRWIRLYSSFSLSSGASHVGFNQSGTGGLTSTVSAALKLFVHTSQYDTNGHYVTARDALTGTLGFGKFDSAASTIGRTIHKARSLADGLPNTETGAPWLRMEYDDPDTATPRTLEFSFYQYGQIIRFTGDGSTANNSNSVLEFWGAGNTGLTYYPILTLATTPTTHEVHVARDQGDVDAIICAYWPGSYPVIYTESGQSAKMDLGVRRLRKVQVNTTNFNLVSGHTLGWTSSTTDPGGTVDTSLSRLSAGVLQMTGTELLVGGAVALGGAGYSGVRLSGSTGSFVDFMTTTTRVATMYNDATYALRIEACDGSTPIAIGGQSGAGAQFVVLITGSATRQVTATGSNGGNPTIATSAGNLAITPAIIGAATSGNALGGVGTSSSTVLNLPAGTTGVSCLRLAHGAAPTSPVNGDVWTTTAGIFVRVNGATVGPLT